MCTVNVLARDRSLGSTRSTSSRFPYPPSKAIPIELGFDVLHSQHFQHKVQKIYSFVFSLVERVISWGYSSHKISLFLWEPSENILNGIFQNRIKLRCWHISILIASLRYAITLFIWRTEDKEKVLVFHCTDIIQIKKWSKLRKAAIRAGGKVGTCIRLWLLNALQWLVINTVISNNTMMRPCSDLLSPILLDKCQSLLLTFAALPGIESVSTNMIDLYSVCVWVWVVCVRESACV